jgi:hypothetical protein
MPATNRGTIQITTTHHGSLRTSYQHKSLLFTTQSLAVFSSCKLHRKVIFDEPALPLSMTARSALT